LSEHQMTAFKERQKQVDLAKERGESHIGQKDELDEIRSQKTPFLKSE